MDANYIIDYKAISPHKKYTYPAGNPARPRRKFTAVVFQSRRIGASARPATRATSDEREKPRRLRGPAHKGGRRILPLSTQWPGPLAPLSGAGEIKDRTPPGPKKSARADDSCPAARNARESSAARLAFTAAHTHRLRRIVGGFPAGFIARLLGLT